MLTGKAAKKLPIKLVQHAQMRPAVEVKAIAFLKPEQLAEIFRRDILDDINLKPLFDQLIGIAPEKPFECVGTISEVNAALQETITKYAKQSLPALLEYYNTLPFTPTTPTTPPNPITSSETSSFQSLLQAWDPQNCLPHQFEELLKGVLYG